MCIEYHREANRATMEAAIRRKGVSLEWLDPEPNRAPGEPFNPTNQATMLRPVDPENPAAGLEGLERRWWLVPPFHKGPVSAWNTVCANARIETVDTAPTFREAYNRRRALIPLTSFIVYEEPSGWRKGSPKRRWETTWAPADESDTVRYFAGLWDRANPADVEGPLESFAFVTGRPGPDIGAVHDRQPAVLTLAQGLDWLRLDGPGKAGLVTETPVGTYILTERPRESVMSPEMRRALP
jgi:putative SOS response-associated peptidase YedK